MSHKNPPDVARVSRIFFYILMFAILGWFTYMQFFGADERRLNVNSDSMVYTGTFTWEKSDGTSEEITVPGRYDLPVGETMVLTTRLPEDYHENTMAIRSSLQDVKFYINGTLRASYNTSKTRMASKNSASRYIFCDTSEADAGKELHDHIADIVPVCGKHRKERAEVQQHVKKVRHIARPLHVQQMLGNGEMSGGRNGQKFRNSLHKAEKNGG